MTATIGDAVDDGAQNDAESQRRLLRVAAPRVTALAGADGNRRPPAQAQASADGRQGAADFWQQAQWRAAGDSQEH